MELTLDDCMLCFRPLNLQLKLARKAKCKDSGRIFVELKMHTSDSFECNCFFRPLRLSMAVATLPGVVLCK